MISPRRIGALPLTSLALLVGAIAGLAMLDQQVPVWSLGGTGPDARTLPRLALIILAGAAALRLGVSLWRASDQPEDWRGWLRAGGIVLATGVGLWVMSTVGFIAAAALVGTVTAVTFGERHLLIAVGLPAAVAALVGLAALYALHVPLP